MPEFLTPYTLHLTPLSPIHLGTGEDYEPTNYIIDNGCLYAFNPTQTCLNEIQRNELLRIAKKGNSLDYQKFFKKNKQQFIDIAHHIVPVSDAVEKEYNARIGNVANREQNGNNVINQLLIERMAVQPLNYQPYIPGSALKGCLRTAILNQYVQNQRTRKPQANKASEFEEELIGKLSSDILRLFKPADLMPKAHITTQIQYATNHKKAYIIVDGKEKEAQGVTSRRETIQHRQYRAFSGSCTLQHLILTHNPHLTTPTPNPQKSLSALSEVAKASNAYYQDRFTKENQILADRELVDSQWLKQTQNLLEELQPQMEEGTIMLVRLGKNTGAESKTYPLHASIKIMQGKDRNPEWQRTTKTVWLAAESQKARQNLLPFGWALIEINPQNDNPQIQQWCEQKDTHIRNTETFQQQLNANQTHRAQQREKKKEIAQQRLEQEAEKKKKEQQQRLEQEEQTKALLVIDNETTRNFVAKLNAITQKQNVGDSTLLQEITQHMQAIIEDGSEAHQRELAQEISIKKLQEKYISLGKREKEIKALLRQLRGEA